MVEIITTDKIQVAEKGNAHCQECHKKILKGEPRLQRYVTTKFGYNPRYVCYRCAKNVLELEMENLNIGLKFNSKNKKKLADTIKKCSKTLIVNTLLETSEKSK